MFLRRLLLQNFRSYPSADFTFSPQTTFIVGPNTAGKSNIIEALHMLSYGKSFRAEKDEQMVAFGADIGRVKVQVIPDGGDDPTVLEITLAYGHVAGKQRFIKKYQINDLPKRRTDFAGVLTVLLFDPTDLDIIAGSPSLRREFLDEVLEQTDRDYRHACLTYSKTLRHRNALLQQARETGYRNEKQFAYWDDLLVNTGQTIHRKRAAFIDWLNAQEKSLFSVQLTYDHSIISAERLQQYKEAEAASGITLVGPHRDDVAITMASASGQEVIEVRSFGSRGQQRLAVVQLKLLQLAYMQGVLADKPVLLLDDIFSELDTRHIRHVLSVVGHQQTIITTTHKEFITEAGVQNPHVIELKK